MKLKFLFRKLFHIVYTGVPVSVGDVFQDPQWMPETSDGSEPYIYMFFPILT